MTSDLIAYDKFLVALRSVAPGTDPTRVAAMLDGEASAELRRLVTVGRRRQLGAFFTPHHLADQLAGPLQDEEGNLTIADTSCGAGDLLLAAQRAAGARVKAPGQQVSLVGVDCVPQFAAAATLRLALQAALLGTRDQSEVSCGDGLASELPRRASHLLLNPPFSMRAAPPGCQWATGKLNGASLFLETAVASSAAGTRVRAILPDVLRSGTRYRAWRERIDELLSINAIQPVGQFDRWTDVDVFILDGTVIGSDEANSESRAGSGVDHWTWAAADATVGDRFEISVGPVVHYRSPRTGPHHPYLTSKNFDAWGRISEIEPTRQFPGRLHSAPFVAIPRTSRPGDAFRARGALVATKQPVGVDNHILIARPKDGLVRTCRDLLRVLRAPSTNAWLDHRIRCRHLTVDAVASIPWASKP